MAISWKQAFLQSFHEWCPWLILSPLVVWLAERFRFDRARWASGVLPHLPACVAVTLAYQGISALLMENTRIFEFRNEPATVGVVSGNLGAVRILSLPGTPPPAGYPAQPVDGGAGTSAERDHVFGV
ncbi:MAG: hypothetical protein AB1705_15645, partial [Verrucomicrobiota bacterium]